MGTTSLEKPGAASEALWMSLAVLRRTSQYTEDRDTVDASSP